MDETIVSSSISIPGKGVTSDPRNNIFISYMLIFYIRRNIHISADCNLHTVGFMKTVPSEYTLLMIPIHLYLYNIYIYGFYIRQGRIHWELRNYQRKKKYTQNDEIFVIVTVQYHSKQVAEGTVFRKPGLGSRSRMFLDPLSRSQMRKKPGAKAGAATKKRSRSRKNMPLLYRLLEDKKHKEVVNFYSSLVK